MTSNDTKPCNPRPVLRSMGAHGPNFIRRHKVLELTGLTGEELQELLVTGVFPVHDVIYYSYACWRRKTVEQWVLQNNALIRRIREQRHHREPVLAD